MSFLILMIPEFIVVIVYYISDCFCFQWKHIDPKMYLKTNFDQLVAALQVLQPIFSMWVIMAQPRVITSFQSSCGIGLSNASFHFAEKF